MDIHYRHFMGFLVAAVCLSVLAQAQPSEELVGSITEVKGTVQVIRGENNLVAEKGTRLYQSDVIRTDVGGGVGVVLRDDTTLSLGPSSELKMAEFKFKPDEGVLGMTLNMVKGTMVYISGQIAKLAPGSAQIETPAGVAAVRGTELLIEVPASKKTRGESKK
jgi:hypothetical protein